MSSDREDLLTKLRDLGITQVNCYYSGSGDEGFIDEIDFKPAEPDQPIRRDLDDFFWEEIIQMHHEGFHNNDGGYGSLVWNIETDKITLHHHDYIMDEVDHGEKEV